MDSLIEETDWELEMSTPDRWYFEDDNVSRSKCNEILDIVVNLTCKLLLRHSCN